MSEREYLTKGEYSALKAALTRAKKKGHAAVVAEVKRAYAIFDAHVWPDQWHTWERAQDDAEYQLARERGAW